MAEDFILTTANNLEGYVIVKQCGLVFGETVFKNSALDSLGAGISNMIDAMRFKATEMSGQMDLIEKARSYAYNKLIEQAKRKGANAVIAIDSDNTIGNGNIMYISLYGTAVKVVSVAEKEAFDKQEKEKREAEEKAKVEREEARRAFLEERDKAYADGTVSPEMQFIYDIDELNSMIDIWKKWKEYNLADIYPEVDAYIVKYKEFERFYGRNDISIRKKEIKALLTGN